MIVAMVKEGAGSIAQQGSAIELAADAGIIMHKIYNELEPDEAETFKLSLMVLMANDVLFCDKETGVSRAIDKLGELLCGKEK